MEMEYTWERKHEVLDDSEYKGSRYVILSLGTHPCCYVRMPEQINKKGFDLGKISCHGGITYSENYLNAENKEKGWWIGWDYAHSGDCLGDDTYGRRWRTEELIRHCEEVIDEICEELAGEGK